MPQFEMICDLPDPNDKEGRTFREVNNATPHKFKEGQLITYEGKHAFVKKLTRDCDGTPLYVIGGILIGYKLGIPEESLSV